MTQSHSMSAVETATNTIIGLLVSWLFTLYGLPYIFGVEFTPIQAGKITACYFVLSFVRCYLIRRAFNGR